MKSLFAFIILAAALAGALAGCGREQPLTPATDGFSAPRDAIDGEAFAGALCRAPHAEWANSCSVSLEDGAISAVVASDCASWHFHRDRKKALWLLKGYDLCAGSGDYAATLEAIAPFARQAGFTLGR